MYVKLKSILPCRIFVIPELVSEGRKSMDFFLQKRLANVAQVVSYLFIVRLSKQTMVIQSIKFTDLINRAW